MTKRYIPIMTESDKELPFYLVQAGQAWNQEHVVRPNGYLYQWIQCVEGEGELQVEGKTHRVKEGMVMLLFKGVAHEYYAISPTWIVDWIVFDGHQVESFLKNAAGIAASGVLYVSKPDIFTAINQSLLDIEHSDIPLRGVQSSSIIYTLLTSMMQYTSKQPNNSATYLNSRLKPLFQYIEQNIAEPLTLDNMAAITDYTPQHLCTVFKKSTGIRIFQYINSVRMKRSKELLLQHPHMQVKEIAALAGFEDVNYFCTVFKKHEQLSPSQYRQMHQ
ncbi:AraC-like DNA-binding protein [Paenibacillus cellulosilyticus]|uniref:AraC-like DNA-binding protein n=1 Tax=Paenibacillus cellulosilyticus TaxID=375489 RepID=A0A2V2YYR3_9BACL|nr:AraC family transcriptional regulator [Paenibacillus cellulosilyticus]PWW07279.1 AraC-like DNA-binding protein [Paenibacillus cellulosilyticus]QKS44533.1 helix-turn-helix transcriptional regulator [Paenibacillus cellulosilyticus]